MADISLAKLLLEIERKRELAIHARKLARGIVHNAVASENLNAYAVELDAEAEQLQAQAAILKQAAAEAANATEPEDSIAALKSPPPAAKPDT